MRNTTCGNPRASRSYETATECVLSLEYFRHDYYIRTRR